MLSHYRAIVEHIDAQAHALGADNPRMAAVRDSQFKHLCTSLRKLRPSIDDSTATMLEVGKATTAFTDDQRQTLAELVSDVSGSESALTGKTQHNMYPYTQLTQGDWTKIMEFGPLVPDAMNVMIDRELSIGCVNPDEASKRAAVATLIVASKQSIGPQQAFSLIETYRSLLAMKRAAYKYPKTVAVFPRDVAELQRQFPSLYPEGTPPPAASIVDE